MTTADLMDRAHSVVAAGGAIYAARQTGLYRINSTGKERSLYSSWLPDQAMPTLALAIDDASGLMLAGISGGVARSTDGGETWEAIPLRSPAPLVTCLAAAPGFAAGGCVLAGTFEDGVFRSTDGGATWLAVNHGLFDHSIYALTLSPRFAEDGVAYAGTSSGIYASENGGRLWQDLSMPTGDDTVLSLALAECGALYAGCEAQGLLRSSDNGDTWAILLETEAAVNAVALTDDSQIAAQVEDRVLSSSDGGLNWQETVASDVDCIALAGESLLLAMSDGSIRQEEW